MGKALYRKYRSKSLSEVVGQEHITSALQKSLDTQNISHAYLFTGPKGVGKTSVARILAHEINGLPYNEDEANHLDIIEIDAASNRRIDEIRDLKDKVHIAPTSAKYKVYIVDEVHMLTKEAFNALLKTLEEPPAHVVFILATTEAHKLPETIISRTQRYTFRPVAEDAVIKHLAGIAKQEDITIDKEALKLIAKHGEGSFRDSISLLDQMRHSSNSINKSDIENALGIAPEELINDTLSALDHGDRDKIVTVLNEIVTQGVDVVRFAHQLSEAHREILVTKTEPPTETDLSLLELLARVSAHPKPAIALDIALFRQMVTKPTASKEKVVREVENKPEQQSDLRKPDKAEPDQATENYDDIHELPPLDPIELQASEPEAITQPVKKDLKNTPDWDSVLNSLKKHSTTLYGVVRMATPTFTDNSLNLGFAFPFHARRVAEERNKRIIEDIIFDVLGKKLTVNATKESKESAKLKPAITPKLAETEPLESVSNIFGRVEIVES